MRRRRITLYAVAVVILGGLSWASLCWAPGVDADVPTLLNAAEFQESILGQHEEALDKVRRALAQEPDNPYAHVLGAKASEGLGHWDESLRYYARAVTLYPDRARRRALRVSALRVLLKAGRWDELEKRGREILDDGPDAITSYLLGCALEERHDDAGALAFYESSIAASGPFDARLRSAALLERFDRREDAIRVLETGLRAPVDTPRGRAWLTLARLRLEGGNRDGAIAALLSGSKADRLLVRRELRQNRLWIPLKKEAAIAFLLEAAPARARE